MAQRASVSPPRHRVLAEQSVEVSETGVRAGSPRGRRPAAEFDLLWRAAESLPLVTSSQLRWGKSPAPAAGGTGRTSMRWPWPVRLSASSQISQASVRCQPVIESYPRAPSCRLRGKRGVGDDDAVEDFAQGHDGRYVGGDRCAADAAPRSPAPARIFAPGIVDQLAQDSIFLFSRCSMVSAASTSWCAARARQQGFTADRPFSPSRGSSAPAGRRHRCTDGVHHRCAALKQAVAALPREAWSHLSRIVGQIRRWRGMEATC